MAWDHGPGTAASTNNSSHLFATFIYSYMHFLCIPYNLSWIINSLGTLEGFDVLETVVRAGISQWEGLWDFQCLRVDTFGSSWPKSHCIHCYRGKQICSFSCTSSCSSWTVQTYSTSSQHLSTDPSRSFGHNSNKSTSDKYCVSQFILLSSSTHYNCLTDLRGKDVWNRNTVVLWRHWLVNLKFGISFLWIPSTLLLLLIAS